MFRALRVLVIAALGLKRATTNGRDLPQFHVANKLVERLHIGAKAMIVADYQPTIRLLSGSDAAFDTTRRQR